MTREEENIMWDGVFAKIDDIKKRSSNPKKIDDFKNELIDTIQTDWQFDTVKQRRISFVSVTKCLITSINSSTVASVMKNTSQSMYFASFPNLRHSLEPSKLR